MLLPCRQKTSALTIIYKLCYNKCEVSLVKRTDYISWDEYFMGIAMLSAQRSKDNSTQVGACIVNKENKIISVGYNGMPTGCIDDEMPWEREADDELDTKYPFVCHAELNAILNSNIQVKIFRVEFGNGFCRFSRSLTNIFYFFSSFL